MDPNGKSLRNWEAIETASGSCSVAVFNLLGLSIYRAILRSEWVKYIFQPTISKIKLNTQVSVFNMLVLIVTCYTTDVNNVE